MKVCGSSWYHLFLIEMVKLKNNRYQRGLIFLERGSACQNVCKIDS